MRRIEQPSLDMVCIASGSTYPRLATEIAEAAGVQEVEVTRTHFPSSEVRTRFEESVRGMDVFIVQSFGQKMAGDGCHSDWSVNDAIVEALIMTDAAKRASASSVTLVAPFFPYARQDRKAQGREPISARAIAGAMTGVDRADRIMSVDLHSGQAQGFTDKPFDHLTAEPVLAEWIRDYIGDSDPGDFVMVAPDAGRAKVTEGYAKRLGADFAMVIKRRDEGGVDSLGLIGDVAAKRCVVVDDMIDTAGTLRLAAETLKNEGAESIVAVATHGVLSGNAVNNIRDSTLDRIVVTNTLPLRKTQAELGERLHVVNIRHL